MVKKRLDYIDAIGGIMILRMVYLHCCGFALTNSHSLVFGILIIYAMSLSVLQPTVWHQS